MIKKKSIFVVTTVIILLLTAKYFLLPKETSPADCHRLNITTEYTKKIQCWENLISGRILKHGTDSGYTLFIDLYNSEPEFVNNCHWFAHIVGKSAYFEFSKGKKTQITSQASYCGYGFYHGFMGAFLQRNNDLTKAKKFCDEMGAKFAQESSDTQQNCYHGIGHGLVDDPPYPTNWGKPEEIVKEPLKMCEKVSPDKNVVRLCTDGVFNALVKMMVQKKYHLDFDTKDPLRFCREMDSKYQRSCYFEYALKLLFIANKDLPKALSYVRDISDESLMRLIIYAISGVLVPTNNDINNKDFHQTINSCHYFDPKYDLTCIKAAASSLTGFGEPGEEYITLLRFCREPRLNNDEKDTCYKELSYLKKMYSRSKVEKICRTIEPKYQKYCSYE